MVIIWAIFNFDGHGTNGLIVFLKVGITIKYTKVNIFLGENASKPAFIREVLEKCRRFCYHQRIVETVPEDFKRLLPDEPVIRFKYRHEEGDDEEDANPAVSCSRKLEYAIRSKASQEEIFEILSEVPKPSSTFGKLILF